MKIFRNFKISLRLFVGFFFLVAITFLVGLYGISMLNVLHDKYEELYRNHGQSLGAIGEIASYYQMTRVYGKDVFIEENGDRSQNLAKIKDLEAKIDAEMKAFEPSAETGADKQHFADLQQLFAQYRPLRDKAVQTALNGDVAGGSRISREEIQPIAEKIQTDIDWFVNNKSAEGNTIAANLSAQAAQANLLMVLIAAVALVVSVLLGLSFTRSIGRPVAQLADEANKLAQGNMDVAVEIDSKDEIGVLSKAFSSVIASVKKLVADTNMLSDAAVAGKLSVRADVSAHQGEYRKVVEGVNHTLDAVIGPLNVASDYIERISRGDVPEKITESYQGDFSQLIDSLNICIDAVGRLVADTNMLATAAVEGRLSVRVDTEGHQGDFRRIIDGINNTLDAVIRPINEASVVLRDIAQGNLGASITGEFRGDYAVIKNEINSMLTTFKGYIGEISYVLSEISAGNLNISIRGDYHGDFVAIKDSLNEIVRSLNDMLGAINAAASQVASGTSQVSDGAQALSQGATEQASAIEQLTTSIGQIAEQTKQNAVNATEASTLSDQVREGALAGNGRMREMLKSMEDINDASSSISKIIKAIDDIAFQTNLLALNAAVEAARAGQYGKGFAVVAEEVRSLAARSANAAKDTTALIEGAIKKVDNGTKIAKETADALGGIVSGVEKASALVDSIAAASNEQATAVSQVSRGIEQVAQVVQTTSATAEESAATSEELSSQAVILREMVGKFRLRGETALESEGFDPEHPSNALPQGGNVAARPQIDLTQGGLGKY